MKRYLSIISICVFTLATSYAQSPVKIKKVDLQQLEIVLKLKEYLASNQNLVFYLPCDNVPGWDNNLTGNRSAIFGNDRFNNKEHAIVFSALHQGLQAKSNNYIKGDFSISVWVNVQSVSKWSRIIDFGKGQNNSNIVFSNSASMSGIPGMAIYNGEGSDITQIRGTEKDRIKEGSWHQIGATLKDKVATLYLDGVEINKVDNFYTPGNVNRPLCLIGKSNFEGESNFYGSMDELRIYDRPLTDLEMKLLAGWIFEYDSITPHDTIAPKSPGNPNSGSAASPNASPNVSPKATPKAIPNKEPDKPINPCIIVFADSTCDSIPVFPLPKELLCSKYTYIAADFPEFKKDLELESAFNNILAPFNKTNMRLISDISKLRAYKEDNYNEKWEHKFVLFPKGDNGIQMLNELGQQGWQLSYYQIVGATLSRPLNPALINKWEYSIVSPPRYARDETELSTNRASAESFLNNIGSQGWEIQSIIKDLHVLQRQMGQTHTFEYKIIHGTGVVPFSLSAEGWEFAASPVIANSVNFQTPIVVKRCNVPNYRIYIAEQIDRMGFFGGGNRHVYRDQDEAIAKYAELGWRYEGVTDGLEGADILFSAPLNCINATKPVIYYNFASNDKAAEYLAVKFAEYVKGKKNCQVIKKIYASTTDVEKAGTEAEKPVIFNLPVKVKTPQVKEIYINFTGSQIRTKIIDSGKVSSFSLDYKTITKNGIEKEIEKMVSDLAFN